MRTIIHARAQYSFASSPRLPREVDMCYLCMRVKSFEDCGTALEIGFEAFRGAAGK